MSYVRRDTSTRRWDCDARGPRDSVRRVLALVGGRAQPHVLLRVRSDLALDLGHLHALVVARVLVEEDCRELFVVDVAVAVVVGLSDYASSSTPSTRRLLDGVAMPVPHPTHWLISTQGGTLPRVRAHQYGADVDHRHQEPGLI